MATFPGGRILLRERAAPSTPPSGVVALYSVDGSALLMKDDAGTVTTLGGGTKLSALPAVTAPNPASEMYVNEAGTSKKLTLSRVRAMSSNASVADQGAGFATDTYLTGSSCAIPVADMQAKAKYTCKFNVTKTGAGVATPIINIRIGTAASTADTSRGTLTFAAQTAVIDEGWFEINAVFRTVGSGTSAVLRTVGTLRHGLSITGFSTAVSGAKTAVSAGFDSTVASSFIGLSVNGGTSAAWTVNLVDAELVNLA